MKLLRRSGTIKLLLFLIVVCVYYILSGKNGLYFFNTKSGEETKVAASKQTDAIESVPYQPIREMVVAVVACGERLEETLTMLKSCLLFSPKAPLKFVIVSDDDLVPGFTEKLTDWQKVLNDSFQFEILRLKFPEKDADNWRKLFKPCASQRLFLPAILTHIDSLIYVDTDTLFLSSVDSLWKHFNEFNSSQMAALALEHEDSSLSWYSRFAKHPYYGKLGVNSGVMLMNLTRMRQFHWEDYVTSVYNRWKTQLTWGDQDIINIIFYYHSEKLFLLDCDANYRPDQCVYGSACQLAAKNGARVLHGSRSAFQSMRQPAFSAVHKTVREYQLGTDPTEYFLDELIKNLESAPESNCGKIQNAFIKIPQQYFEKSLT